MFKMLQKSSIHWCHYSQGERGPWWQHTWQLAELLTAIKLFGTERPDVFIKLVLTKLLRSRALRITIFLPNCVTLECGNTEIQNRKRVSVLEKNHLWVWMRIYMFAFIYIPMFYICRQIHWIIFTWSCQLQLQNPEVCAGSQLDSEWCSCQGTQVKSLKGDHSLSSSTGWHRRSQPLP